MLPKQTAIPRLCAKLPLLLALFMAVVSIGCGGPKPTPPIPSPDGKHLLTTEISGEEAGPTRRLCVILILQDASGNELTRFQTGASDRMKWAVAWHDNDTVILHSSDIGAYAYNVTVRPSFVERAPEEDEFATGRKAYADRYGKEPRY